MSDGILLQDRVAVIYGGGGAIGGAVARAFARQGARVYLAGRTQAPLDRVAREIRSADGKAETSVVDALDEEAVDRHADAVADQAGGIDVCLNAISVGDVQGTALAEMPLTDYEQPITVATRSQFLTSKAAARHMIPKRSGVILFFGGEGRPLQDYYLGGFQVALSAVESFRRQLAAELGPHGIRVISLQSAGVPETIPEDFAGAEAITDQIVGLSMLKRAATLEDVGNVAVFAASDLAAVMTGTALNITAGTEVD